MIKKIILGFFVFVGACVGILLIVAAVLAPFNEDGRIMLFDLFNQVRNLIHLLADLFFLAFLIGLFTYWIPSKIFPLFRELYFFIFKK